jgi:hypothetical protein
MKAGTHAAIAKEVELGLDEGTRDRPPEDMVAVQFEIVEGECKGETIGWKGTLGTDRNRNGVEFAEFSLEAMRAMGWDGSADVETMKKNKVLLKVVESETSGALFVKYVNRPGLRVAKPTADVGGFLQRLAARKTHTPDDGMPF